MENDGIVLNRWFFPTRQIKMIANICQSTVSCFDLQLTSIIDLQLTSIMNTEVDMVYW